MPSPPLTLRLPKGSPLTPLEMDRNLEILRDFSNALEALFNVALNPDGTLKAGAINNTNQVGDRILTNSDMNWLFNFFGTATMPSADTYVLALSPTTGFTKGDGVTTSLVVYVKFPSSNGGPATLNINSDGAQPIVKNSSSGPGMAPLVAGDITGGGIGCLVWNSTAYQLIGFVGGTVTTNPTAYLYDIKATGAPGGAFTVLGPTSPAVGPALGNIRTLNYEDDPFNLVTSLSANQFTLDPGTYDLQAQVPAHRVGKHKAFLYKVLPLPVAYILHGSSEYNDPTENGMTSSFINGRFTITVASAFEIRHLVQQTGGTPVNDGGQPSNFTGINEVYTQVRITKRS